MLCLRFVGLTLVLALGLSACVFLPLNTPLPSQPVASQPGFQVLQTQDLTDTPLPEPEMLQFPSQVTPQILAQSSSLPNQGSFHELRFSTQGHGLQQIHVPEHGDFELILEAGGQFALPDNDARDGSARVQVPAQVLDLYLRPEAGSTCLSPQAPESPLLDQLDQFVLAKAAALNAAGQSQCVYLPPENQRQNGNCNSDSQGLNCSGALNKQIVAAQCPEIVVYGGAMNLNHALPDSKLFVAVSNNLTLNASVQGILATRGDLNTNLNNQAHLQGVFVGARSNNLGMGGSSSLKGLYSIVNHAFLNLNLNQSAAFEGALCQQGPLNVSRNGDAQLIYQPAAVTPWLSELPFLPQLFCAADNRPYTQVHPNNCNSAAPANAYLQIRDPLYYVDQRLEPGTDWAHLPQRPLPVPASWHSPDGQRYVLRFSNQGLAQTQLRLYARSQAPSYPVGMAEIGPAGGTLSLPGVGKIELPPGALSEPTVIVMRQITQHVERLGYDPRRKPPYYRIEDFISPIVQLEPQGLALNQPGRIWLQTDLARLGNNDPAVIRWSYQDQSHAEFGNIWWDHLESDARLNTPLAEWTADMPADLTKLVKAAKMISSGIKPDSHYGVTDSPGLSDEVLQQLDQATDFESQALNFAIQALGVHETRVFRISYPKRDGLTVPGFGQAAYSEEEIKNWGWSMDLAYVIFLKLTSTVLHPLWDDGLIPVEIGSHILYPAVQPNFANRPGAQVFFPAPTGGAIAHENWHLFQLSEMNAAKFSQIAPHDRWLLESTAVHMGAYAALKSQQFSFPAIYNNLVKDDYFPYVQRLNESQRLMASSLLYRPYIGDSNVPNAYNNVGFFSFLSHPQVMADKDDLLAILANTFAHESGPVYGKAIRALNTVLENRLSEHFIDFAEHALTKDRYAFYPLIKQPPLADVLIHKTPDNASSIKSTPGLPCLSASYSELPKSVKAVTLKDFGNSKDNPHLTMSVQGKRGSLGQTLQITPSTEPVILSIINASWDCPVTNPRASTAYWVQLTRAPSLSSISPSTLPKNYTAQQMLLTGESLEIVDQIAVLSPLLPVAVPGLPFPWVDAHIFSAAANAEGTQLTFHLPAGFNTLGQYHVYGLVEPGEAFTIASDTLPTREFTNEVSFEITDEATAGFQLLAVEPGSSETDQNVVFRGKGFSEGSYSLYFTDFEGQQSLQATVSSLVTDPETLNQAQPEQLLTVSVPHAAISGPVFARRGT